MKALQSSIMFNSFFFENSVRLQVLVVYLTQNAHFYAHQRATRDHCKSMCEICSLSIIIHLWGWTLCAAVSCCSWQAPDRYTAYYIRSTISTLGNDPRTSSLSISRCYNKCSRDTSSACSSLNASTKSPNCSSSFPMLQGRLCRPQRYWILLAVSVVM